MLRILPLFAVLAAVIVLPLAAASGSTQTFRLDLSASEVNYRETEPGRVAVLVDGYSTLNYLDYPSLPYKVFNMLVPQGEEVLSVSIEVGDVLELDPSIPLALFEGELRDDGVKVGAIAAERGIGIPGCVLAPGSGMQFMTKTRGNPAAGKHQEHGCKCV